MVQFGSLSYSAREAEGNVTVTVIRTGGLNNEIEVEYSTSDGTAVVGLDYHKTTGTLTFDPGVSSQVITVPVEDDTKYEANEVFKLSLSDLTGNGSLGARKTASITILDNDTPPAVLQFSTSTFRVSEGGVSAVITVSRTGAAGDTMTVEYETGDGTAAAGSDYTSVSGILTFGPGVASQVFNVPITDDTVYEKSEYTKLALSNVTGNAVLGSRKTANLSILDDDSPPAKIQFASSSYRASESSLAAIINLTRIGSVEDEVTIDYTTADGTAEDPADYTQDSDTVTFASGERNKSFTVDLQDDADYEGSETVKLRLSNPTGNAVLGTQKLAVLTILDNDSPPAKFQFSASYYRVYENRDATITVTRTGTISAAMDVEYSTSDVTADEGSDYTAASGTLSFGVGERRKTFTIDIDDDAVDERNETLKITLSDPTGNSTLGTLRTVTLTILDND